MKTISVINIKGGVAKTISSINIAYNLMAVHGYRILIIDNDKQGNSSKFFGLHSYELPSISEVLTEKGYDIRSAIRKTSYENLDVLPANMTLLKANKEILLDVSRPQQTRLRKALCMVVDQYDYVIIDNAPDINMSVINALVASDDVLIPIKVDKFAFDGLEILTEQVEEVKEFNPSLKIAGCFITMYQNTNVNRQGVDHLKRTLNIPVFDTLIHKTVKVDETTFTGIPLIPYARNNTASRDYVALVKEYLNCARI
ncbi:MAG: ParA family protein [Clostridia bacterium]|nr:ParA family protein [Clostridia bacterium]